MSEIEFNPRNYVPDILMYKISESALIMAVAQKLIQLVLFNSK